MEMLNAKTTFLWILVIYLLGGCNNSELSVDREDADLIIALGLQVNYKSCNARLLLQQRVDKAYQVSKTKKNPIFAFTGKGNPKSLESCFDESGQGLTESKAMKEYLMAKYKVAENKIILEEESTSTDENAKFLKPLLDRYSSENGFKFTSMSLVTSGYHNHRLNWRDGSDISSVFYFNRDFGERTFEDGKNVYDASVLAVEEIWSDNTNLIAAGGNNTSNTARLVGDVNGDGKGDIVRIDRVDESATVYFNYGSMFKGPSVSAIAYPSSTNVQLFDMNGDGYDDLIGVDSNSGAITMALSNGHSGFEQKVVSPSSLSSILPVGEYDENTHFYAASLATENSNASLVIFAKRGTYSTEFDGVSIFSVARKLFDDFGTTSSVDGSTYVYGDIDSNFPRVLGDVTGDGLDDIVAFGTNSILVAENDGAGRFLIPRPWLSNDEEGNGFNFTIESNNAELVLGEGWGDVYWDSSRHVRGLSDVNGDGRDDIWAIGEHGVYVSWSADIDRNGLGDHFENLNSVWVYESKWRHNNENDSAYQQYTPYRGWEVSKHPRYFIDLNGDRRADLIGFGEQAVFVSLSE